MTSLASSISRKQPWFLAYVFTRPIGNHATTGDRRNQVLPLAPDNCGRRTLYSFCVLVVGGGANADDSNAQYAERKLEGAIIAAANVIEVLPHTDGVPYVVCITFANDPSQLDPEQWDHLPDDVLQRIEKQTPSDVKVAPGADCTKDLIDTPTYKPTGQVARTLFCQDVDMRVEGYGRAMKHDIDLPERTDWNENRPTKYPGADMEKSFKISSDLAKDGRFLYDFLCYPDQAENHSLKAIISKKIPGTLPCEPKPMPSISKATPGPSRRTSGKSNIPSRCQKTRSSSTGRFDVS